MHNISFIPLFLRLPMKQFFGQQNLWVPVNILEVMPIFWPDPSPILVKKATPTASKPLLSMYLKIIK